MLISSHTAKDYHTAFYQAYEELAKTIEAEGYEPNLDSLEVTRDSYGNTYGWLCSMKTHEQS